MNRLLPITGVLATAMGAGSLLPVMLAWQANGSLDQSGRLILLLGVILMVGGMIVTWRGFRREHMDLIPAPVRAAMLGNILFLAFCALETSDGLVRQGGRTSYWTTMLLLPALVVLYGQILAQRWAWWVARIISGLFAAWFVLFLAIIPFGNFRGNNGAVPWWGRLYMAAVTLVFAGVSIYAFRSLGRPEARDYFQLARKA